VRNFLRVLFVLVAGLSVTTLHASAQHGSMSVLERFLAMGDGPVVEYRALRHLEADNPHFKASAWMDAWTEYDHAGGFRYQIVGEGGSGYIRNHVLRVALDGERKMWMSREPQKASFTRENYEFHDRGAAEGDGLTPVGVTPRRKDVLLIDGSIFVHTDDGDLRRIEGQLSKAPSIWTRRVEIIREYDRIGGVRVPISIESVAHVLIAGRSTFKMTYAYETINGQPVGTPTPISGNR
jgi:hypothetical protein